MKGAVSAYQWSVDPLTQGLAGGLAAHAGFRSKLGPRATWIGAAAGMAPDLDVVIGGVGRLAGDEFLGLEFHRQFTHSLVFAPLGALLVAALLRRGAPWGLAFGCALVGWLTHGPLDGCTTYGTELWWPFDRSRVAWNNVAIVDPVFTAVLAVGLFGSGILHRRGRSKAGWTAALCGMSLSLAYLGWGTVRRDAVEVVAREELASRAQAVRRVMVSPTPLNNVLWRVVAQLDDGRWVNGLGRIGWAEAEVRLSAPMPDERPEQAPEWTRTARGLAVFEHFTSGWTRWKRRPGGQGWRVIDMRYAGGLSDPRGDGLWGVDVTEVPDAAPQIVRYRGGVRPDMGDFADRIFKGLAPPGAS